MVWPRHGLMKTGGASTAEICIGRKQIIVHCERLQPSKPTPAGPSAPLTKDYICRCCKALQTVGHADRACWHIACTVSGNIARRYGMRIAISAQGKDLDALVDPRFGRARFFVIMDTVTGEWSVADNVQNLNAAQGAGIQAGRTIVEQGVEALITGHVGPKAFATLLAGGVKVYTGANGAVSQAVEQFKAGQLKPSTGADVEGHWV